MSRLGDWLTKNRQDWGWRAEAWRTMDQQRDDLVDPSLAGIATTVSAQLSDLEASLKDPATRPDRFWPTLHRVDAQMAAAVRGRLQIDYARRAVATAEDPSFSGKNAFSTVKDSWDRVQKVAAHGKVDAGAVDELAQDLALVRQHEHHVTDARHAAMNTGRLRLYWASIGTMALALLIIVSESSLTRLEFLVGANHFTNVPPVQIALLVALGGLVGGSLGALRAFASSRADVYRTQYARAALRLSLGVLSALVGVSVVGAGWSQQVAANSGPVLFGISVAFGASQEPLTRYLENKGRAALDTETSTGST